MSFVTFTPGRQHLNVELKPLSTEQREEFRQTASEIASSVLGNGSVSSLMCTETLDERPVTPPAPKIRQEVSARNLEELERAATTYYLDLNSFVQSMKSLITYVEERLDETDFSNGYEEDSRNSATLQGMEALFRTYMTLQSSFEQKCGYLDEDRKLPAIKVALTRWFNAAMGNLSLKILKEVAINNQNSRRGQFNLLHENEKSYPAEEFLGLRDYILDRIGALDLEGNPDGWAEAALFDLEKLLALPSGIELLRFSAKEQQVVGILRQSLALLNRYSH